MLKGVDRQVAARAQEYIDAFGRYTISVITVAEIVKGFHRLGREDRIQRFLDNLSDLEILPLDAQGAQLAGRIYADLERAGQPIGRADPMIAAIAVQHDLTLATGNTAHYQRVADLGYPLKLDNWRVRVQQEERRMLAQLLQALGGGKSTEDGIETQRRKGAEGERSDIFLCGSAALRS